MASVILTVVGTALGGPIGGVIGGLVGRNVDQAIFGGTSSRTIEGGRIKDLTVQTSAYGVPVSRIYGTMRVPGNVVWSAGLKEVRNENTESSGGKGRGQKVTTVTYSYSASFAVALSGREISDIGRIWADGKLLRNGNGTMAVGGALRIYKGTNYQNADPLIEALEGQNNVNAFRHMSYVVFEDLELGDYANRIPNLTFEIIADNGGGILLSTVVGDICDVAQISSYDVSDLTQMVSGYMIQGPMKSRSAIEELSQIYHFDVIEKDNMLLFRSLARPSDITILSDDLVLPSKGGDKITITRQQDLELPKEIGVSFIDPDRDYQAGHQRAKRLNVASQMVRQNAYPLVISSSQAKSISEVQLDLAWYGREGAKFTLPHKYSDLTPGDIITLDRGSILQDFLLQETEVGLKGVNCSSVKFSQSQLDRNSLADSGLLPLQQVDPLATSQLHFLDIPTITGDNVMSPVLFWAVAAGGGKWAGAGLFMSRDEGNTYSQLDSLGADVVSGIVENILSDGPTAFWDLGNELIVRLDNDDHNLSGVTADAVLNGANVAWVGGEIIQYQNVTLEPDGSYRLQGLLRGRRGTERLAASHGVSEIFILLTEATVSAAAMTFSDIGKTYMFKVATIGAPVENSLPIPHKFDAEILKPFSPVHEKAVRDSSGNITLNWVRRSRVGGDWTDNADVPLGELYEKYDIEILQGGNMVRTLTSEEPVATYSAAAQIEDFGIIQSNLDIRIFQISDNVGRGWPLTVSI